MPIVQVTLTEGRSREEIRSMISKITEAVVESGVAPKANIRVLVSEIPQEHFAAGDVTIAERHAAQAAAPPEQADSAEDGPEGHAS